MFWNILKILVAAALFFLPVTLNAEGVHIITVEEQGNDTWHVLEFLDLGLVNYPAYLDSFSSEVINTSVVFDPDQVELTMLSAETSPILVFSAQNVEPAEENLLHYTSSLISRENSDEISNQVATGIFQIPLWPFLAVTEFPVGNIDKENRDRLDDYRDIYFPAAQFVSVTGAIVVQVQEINPGSVTVSGADVETPGMGLVMQYLLKGKPEYFGFSFQEHASAIAFYSNSRLEWNVSGDNLKQARDINVLNELLRPVDHRGENNLYSKTIYFTGENGAVRYLYAPGRTTFGKFTLRGTGMEFSEPSATGGDYPGPLLSLLILWLGFTVLVLLGNYMYKFSDLPVLDLVGRILFIYPVIAIVSFITLGFWGLGFVPASVLASGLVARNGKRMAASGVFIGAIFIIMMGSWLLLR